MGISIARWILQVQLHLVVGWSGGPDIVAARLPTLPDRY